MLVSDLAVCSRPATLWRIESNHGGTWVRWAPYDRYKWTWGPYLLAEKSNGNLELYISPRKKMEWHGGLHATKNCRSCKQFGEFLDSKVGEFDGLDIEIGPKIPQVWCFICDHSSDFLRAQICVLMTSHPVSTSLVQWISCSLQCFLHRRNWWRSQILCNTSNPVNILQLKNCSLY